MPEQTCPYLGFLDDNTTATAYPDNRNVCHRAQPPCAVSMQHQGACCLRGVHRECAGFRHGWGKGIPKELSPVHTRKSLFDINKLWMYIIAFILLLVIGGIFIGAIQMGPAPVATLPGGISLYTTTPFSLYEPTNTVTPIPTPTATLVPTETPEVVEEPVSTETPYLPDVILGLGLRTPFVSGDHQLVIVQLEEDETLDSIAEMYETTRVVLALLNGLNADPSTGDTLVVMVGQQAENDLPVLRAFYVEHDMMLDELAVACDCSWDELMVWNSFGDVDSVEAGSWVVVEGGGE